jgi:hypothetical protein
MTPTDELRARVLQAVRAEGSAPRATWRWITAQRLTVAFLITGISFWVLGGIRSGGITQHHHVERPAELVLATALGAALITCVAAWLSWRRGRSMLGPSRATLVAVVLLVPAALLAWKTLLSVSVPGMTIPWPERVGLKCLSLTIGFCVPPLLALAWLRRASQPVTPGWSGAALGVTVGAVSWVLVDLWCPVGYFPHLLLGHYAPQLALAAVGAIVGQRLLSPRTDTT